MDEAIASLLALAPSLEALVLERNVTRAARRLGLSQSRMSQRLKQLRALLNDPLLTPAAHGRGMVATPRAERLRGEVAELLALAAATLHEREAFDPPRSARTFHMLCTDQAASVMVPILLAKLEAAGASHIRLAFHDARNVRLTHRLEQGQADFVFAVSSELKDEPELKRLVIQEERSVLAFRRGRFPSAVVMDVDKFCNGDFVVVSDERDSFSGPADTLLRNLGRERRVGLSVPTFMLALAAVARSNLFAIVPRRLVELFGALVDYAEIPFDFPTYSYVAAWHPRLDGDSGHRWLRGQFRLHAKPLCLT